MPMTNGMGMPMIWFFVPMVMATGMPMANATGVPMTMCTGTSTIGKHAPGRGNGRRGSFFRPSKTTFRRVLKNQILIENDDENGDDNGDNFDA